MKSLSVVAVALGLLFLVVSVLWGVLFPPASSWTVEKNDRMSELSLKGHALSGELDAARRRPSMHGKSADQIEAEYKQVSEELKQLREDFESKRDSPKTMAKYLRWSGIAFVIAGAIIVFANRDA
jgi:hypothetical protein